MDDLEFLINRYIDGRATSDEVDRLNELLRASAEARQVFIAHMDLDSAMGEAAAGLPGQRAAVSDIIQINRWAVASHAFAYSISAFSLVLLVCVSAWLWQVSTSDASKSADATSSAGVVAEAEAAPPAILVDEAAAMFATGKEPHRNKLPKGDYELLSGVAQVRFQRGAEMILTGPARLEIIDAQHARVDNGRIRVIVPPTATGFTVSTPAAEYIDLGTEFGLDVNSQSGTSDLYVLDGQVNVADKSSRRIIENVREGDSSRCEQGVLGSAPKFVSADFPTPNQIGLVRWQKHADRLVEDPSLLALYTFQPTANRTELNNSVLSRNDAVKPVASHGSVVGARWVSGRWPGKKALLFDGDDEYVELEIPGSYQEMTIAAWLKIDRLDYEMNALLNSNLAEHGDVHFQISRQGLPKGGLQGAATEDHYIGPPVQLGRWVHLAMVIANDRTRRVFANGELVREGFHKHVLDITPGVCRIGNWLPSVQPVEKRVRAFRGKIDEVAVWNRAVQASELKEMAQAGRPCSNWQN